jgi:hypothetical protein
MSVSEKLGLEDLLSAWCNSVDIKTANTKDRGGVPRSSYMLLHQYVVRRSQETYGKRPSRC